VGIAPSNDQQALSEMIGVHPNTLRTWADKGILHAVKLPSGNRWFTLEEIDQVRRESGRRNQTQRPPVA